jgi:predicted nuclease of predicted toxin-antitoxin system
VRILLDECVNARIKAAFAGHVVKTVAEMGWRGAKDSLLLTYAQNSFDVFITIDRKLEHQHNLTELKLGIVIARVLSNEITAYLPILPSLLEAAESVKLVGVIHVRARA